MCELITDVDTTVMALGDEPDCCIMSVLKLIEKLCQYLINDFTDQKFEKRVTVYSVKPYYLYYLKFTIIDINFFLFILFK